MPTSNRIPLGTSKAVDTLFVVASTLPLGDSDRDGQCSLIVELLLFT